MQAYIALQLPALSVRGKERYHWCAVAILGNAELMLRTCLTPFG